MDESDKKILENAIAVPIGKAVCKWAKMHNIDQPVIVHASVTQPSCYIDEQGVSHTGNLIVVDCDIVNEEESDDD